LNCHRARQLISPFLDQQLTGRQMLDLQSHFSECVSCEAEARSLRQLKSLLRGLHSQQPARNLPETIIARASAAETNTLLWSEALLPLSRPQRGRRLTTALAFSCLTVFAFAAPFAPAARDVTVTAGILGSGHFPTGFSLFSSSAVLNLPPEADLRPASYQSLTESDEARSEKVFAARYLPTADPAAASLADDAVRGYVQGDAAFAGYRVR
jgi:hypothetical protein